MTSGSCFLLLAVGTSFGFFALRPVVTLPHHLLFSLFLITISVAWRIALGVVVFHYSRENRLPFRVLCVSSLVFSSMKVLLFPSLFATIMFLTNTVRSFTTLRIGSTTRRMITNHGGSRSHSLSTTTTAWLHIPTTTPGRQWFLTVTHESKNHLNQPTSGAAPFSSSSSSGTSIVTICQEKIQKALNAQKVQVTGTCIHPYMDDCYESTTPNNKVSLSRTILSLSLSIPKGAYDDPNGSHISIQVVATAFQGKRPVQRQQMVYKALWEELQGPVHAVDSMVCQTPEEAI